MRRLGIRVDGDAATGTGHVMRCLALAQAWRDQAGEAHFISASLSDGLRERLAHEGFGVTLLEVSPGSMEDAEATSAVAGSQGIGWLALDGYCFRPEYQRRLSGRGWRTVMLDDAGDLGPYTVDIIVNQNLHASAEMYRGTQGVQLLLGPEYVLLRDEFVRRTSTRGAVPDTARHVLVTLGGSDPAGHTVHVLEAFKTAFPPDSEAATRCIAVVGASNLRAQQVLATGASDSRVEVRQAVTDMAALMEWADMAVTSGGTTVWELAYMGVPAIVGSVSPVERLLGAGVEERGVSSYVGAFSEVAVDRLAGTIMELAHSSRRRAEMDLAGRRLVDGQGRARVVSIMREAPSSSRHDFSQELQA